MDLQIQIDPASEYKEFYDRLVKGTDYTIAETTDFFNDSTRSGKDGISNLEKAGVFDSERQFLMTMIHVLVDHATSLLFMKALLYRSYLELREGKNILCEIFLYRACAGGGIVSAFSDSTTAADTTVARQQYNNGAPTSDNGYKLPKPVLCRPTSTYELKHRFAAVDTGSAPRTVANAANSGDAEFAVHVCGFVGRHV